MQTMGNGRRQTSQSLLFLFLFSLLQRPAFAAKKSYIVYLGGHAQTREEAHLIDHDGITDTHYEFLGSILGSKEKAREAMFYSYTRFINGFAANLEEEEVMQLKNHPGVISVFPNRPRKLFTTHSWEFLGLEKDGHVPEDSAWKKANFGEDVIIGVMDTGVWPESHSFNDEGIGPIPSRWRGTCDTKDGVKCNRKLIGARFFNQGYLDGFQAHKDWNNFTIYQDAMRAFFSARDYEGHGTHTLSTAGGRFVTGANVFGHANGTAKGGSPRARLASYKVCGPELPDGTGGCYGSDILKGFAAAIYDGVDVISLSLGASDMSDYDYVDDASAIGSFHAMMHGVLVVAAGGNSGPYEGTVSNVAPWMLTVGATSMDREFPSFAALGNSVRLKGQSFSGSKLSQNRHYPLIKEEDALAVKAPLNVNGSLDPGKVKGKIVICQRGGRAPLEMSKSVSEAGAAGMIYINNMATESVVPDLNFLPTTHLSYDDGLAVLSYINSTKYPVAYITYPETTINTTIEPVVISFSSRGPNSRNSEILKPDITAPGLYILAAYSEAAKPTGRPDDPRRVTYNVLSGTSMACPHVSGIVGLLKALHPDWSPSAIKSAIMTTATPVKWASPYFAGAGEVPRDQILPSVPFDAGSGNVNPNGATDPGLVYDTRKEDHFHFLCSLGYNANQISNFTDVAMPSTCPSRPPRLIDFNYPSITVPNLTETTTVRRQVKNVGVPATYTASVEAPEGITVTVKPSTLQFEEVGSEKKFEVTFQAAGDAVVGRYVFGSLTWSDGEHFVRSPMVVRPTNKSNA